MGKVRFEFDELEDKSDINMIVNRHKMWNALFELSNFRRTIYKGYTENDIVVKDNQVVVRGKEKLVPDYDIEGAKSYLDDDEVLRNLDYILDDIRFLLD